MFLFNCGVKQLILLFDLQNNKGLGKGYQPHPWASADNPHLDLDYSGYHKNLIQQLYGNLLTQDCINTLKFLRYW